jgi:hypothetical protein
MLLVRRERDQGVSEHAGEEETMPSDGSTEELSLAQQRIIDGFDEVAKGLAAGTISRRRALKLTGSALLGGGLLALFPRVAGAQGGCAGRPAINNRRCPETSCGSGINCFCATTVGGTKRCVSLENETCPASDECDRNSDCASGELCIKTGGCCEGSRRNLCVRPCGV